MNLLGLRYFIAVAEYLSFTKASEHLYVTQPTLSRQILDIEAELGVQLFVRSRHSLTLTEQGMLFLHEAREIIKRCDNIINIVKPEKSHLSGELSIGYQGFLDTDYMHKVLKSLAKNHPLIDVSLFHGSPPELRHHLLIGKCDAVFALNTCVDSLPDITSIKIRENQMQIAVPGNHRLASYDSVDLKELANEDFIMLDRKVSPFTVDYAVSLCMKNGFSPNASYYVTDAEKALLMVGSGKGITFLHSMNNLSNPCDSYDIKVLSIEGLEHDLDFVLAYKEDNVNPAIPIFVSELKGLLKTVNDTAAEPH
jgi:DNA-binding transcriptional LysR family regulator